MRTQEGASMSINGMQPMR